MTNQTGVLLEEFEQHLSVHRLVSGVTLHHCRHPVTHARQAKSNRWRVHRMDNVCDNNTYYHHIHIIHPTSYLVISFCVCVYASTIMGSAGIMLSGRRSICCLSVNTYFVWCDTSVLSGRISMKLATHIHQVDKHCWKVLKVRGQRLRSWLEPTITEAIHYDGMTSKLTFLFLSACLYRLLTAAKWTIHTAIQNMCQCIFYYYSGNSWENFTQNSYLLELNMLSSED